jgi:outer membrane protein insertion porin family
MPYTIGVRSRAKALEDIPSFFSVPQFFDDRLFTGGRHAGEFVAGASHRCGARPPTAQKYRVRELKVTGATFLKPEFLAAELRLAAGDVFDEVGFRKGIDDMKKLYGSLGYFKAEPVVVLEFDEQQKVVTLTVDIREGRLFRVNRITITGNTTTPDEVIRGLVSVKEGYVYNAAAWDHSMLRLNQLGRFEEIRIEDVSVNAIADEPRVDIELRLREKKQ